MSGYLLLFASSFLAATILPFYSEVVLFALLRNGGDPFWLVVTATVGNTGGAVVNWLLGIYLLHFRERRWFQRYGFWTLLLAWMPVGGDALTLIAGIMRVPLWLFLLLVATGKGLRYVSVVYLSNWWS